MGSCHDDVSHSGLWALIAESGAALVASLLPHVPTTLTGLRSIASSRQKLRGGLNARDAWAESWSCLALGIMRIAPLLTVEPATTPAQLQALLEPELTREAAHDQLRLEALPACTTTT